MPVTDNDQPGQGHPVELRVIFKTDRRRPLQPGAVDHLQDGAAIGLLVAAFEPHLMVRQDVMNAVQRLRLQRRIHRRKRQVVDPIGGIATLQPLG